MRALLNSLMDFLLFHGVILSAHEDAAKSKTIYVQINDPEVHSSVDVWCYNRDSRPEGNLSLRSSPYHAELTTPSQGPCAATNPSSSTLRDTSP